MKHIIDYFIMMKKTKLDLKWANYSLMVRKCVISAIYSVFIQHQISVVFHLVMEIWWEMTKLVSDDEET